MEFKNTSEMENIFSQIGREAIIDITREMKNRIEEKIFEKGIGFSSKGEGYYNPTGEFQEAWITEIPKRISSDEYQGEMHYEPYMIKTISPENFIHGSNYWSQDDVSDILPNLIFEGKSGDFFGKGFWTEPRDAWSPMISSMDNSFSKLMRDSFAKQGVKLDTKRTYRNGGF